MPQFDAETEAVAKDEALVILLCDIQIEPLPLPLKVPDCV